QSLRLWHLRLQVGAGGCSRGACSSAFLSWGSRRSSSRAPSLALLGKEPAMTNDLSLPHEKLHAYQEACSVLDAVREADILDSHLRDQALRAATRCCLNIAEGAGRTGSADKARVYGIARGENLEAAATLGLAL